MSPTPLLSPGTPAPDFELPCTPDQRVSLSSLRGQPVILAFYPADWSPVCGDQMALYNQILPEFRRAGAQLLGISVDGAWCHAAFSAQRQLHFPLLADFEPKGAVARRYGAYRQADGICERALFVIDGLGVRGRTQPIRSFRHGFRARRPDRRTFNVRHSEYEAR